MGSERCGDEQLAAKCSTPPPKIQLPLHPNYICPPTYGHLPSLTSPPLKDFRPTLTLTPPPGVWRVSSVRVNGSSSPEEGAVRRWRRAGQRIRVRSRSAARAWGCGSRGWGYAMRGVDTRAGWFALSRTDQAQTRWRSRLSPAREVTSDAGITSSTSTTSTPAVSFPTTPTPPPCP